MAWLDTCNLVGEKWWIHQFLVDLLWKEFVFLAIPYIMLVGSSKIAEPSNNHCWFYFVLSVANVLHVLVSPLLGSLTRICVTIVESLVSCILYLRVPFLLL